MHEIFLVRKKLSESKIVSENYESLHINFLNGHVFARLSDQKISKKKKKRLEWLGAVLYMWIKCLSGDKVS